jgi:hypothetical protein
MRQVFLDELRELAQPARGEIDYIYLHWTAGHYNSYFADYHINIGGDGSIRVSTDDFTEVLKHTYQRNSRAVGVALACCYNATPLYFGDEPPTPEQIEALAQVVAVLVEELEVPMQNVLTHAEAADEDGYGPATTCERWDLWKLSATAAGGSGGDIIRARAMELL